jgi:hypothetical protein
MVRTGRLGGLHEAISGLIVPSYCRDSSRVNEEWFTDTEAVQASVGIVDSAAPVTDNSSKVRL